MKSIRENTTEFEKSYKELIPEQELDYLLNLNKILEVRTRNFERKFKTWKEMNFFKVVYTCISL